MELSKSAGPGFIEHRSVSLMINFLMVALELDASTGREYLHALASQ